MWMKNKPLIFLALCGLFQGCMEENPLSISEVDLYGSRGVFIVNEGNYTYGNGSISYYDIESGKVINEIYATANGVPVGDVAYSMTIFDGKGYIVVNNSSCIHVVDANTLLHCGTIENLPSPRHILFIDDETALVSDLYARGISIINPKTLKVTGRIKTGTKSSPYFQHSTESFIKIGSKIYTNCWSYDSKLLVINSETLSLADSLDVGIQPLAMAKDRNNNIWVINDGGFAGNPIGYEIPSLMRVNTSNNTVGLRLNFASQYDNVGQIATNRAGDTLYYICNHLYAMHIDDIRLPETYLIPRNGRNFRALAVDPFTGDIYLSDAADYMSEGTVYRFKSNGIPIDTIDVGIIPGNFCFN
jgi:hypothetical protein